MEGGRRERERWREARENEGWVEGGGRGRGGWREARERERGRWREAGGRENRFRTIQDVIFYSQL